MDDPLFLYLKTQSTNRNHFLPSLSLDALQTGYLIHSEPKSTRGRKHQKNEDKKRREGEQRTIAENTLKPPTPLPSFPQKREKTWVMLPRSKTVGEIEEKKMFNILSYYCLDESFVGWQHKEEKEGRRCGAIRLKKKQKSRHTQHCLEDNYYYLLLGEAKS